MKPKTLLLVFFVLPFLAHAGNIQVSNVLLTGQDAAADTYQVQFDLSWESSWRTSTFESNWDAAWVVIKYRLENETVWTHANISPTGSAFPSGSAADFAGDDGCFIYRDADGIGDVNYQNISIRWVYGNAFADDQILEVCVLALEMVYIPEGAFQVGDGDTNGWGNFSVSGQTSPYTIQSEDGLTLGGFASSNLGVINQNVLTPDDFSISTTQALPDDFPKGFQAFYIMKYELTQQQYADFLNKIPENFAADRFPDLIPDNGNQLTDAGTPPFVYATTAPDVPQGRLSYADGAAYADWIALRPMTELEYEKACRGSRPAIASEKAWGNTFLSNQNYTMLNVEQADESIQDLPQFTGNACYFDTSLPNGQRPFRSGIFAFSSVNGTRQETGASYYGVMELSGNLEELVISVGSSEGRLFRGSHGNGVLSSTGNHTNFLWPDAVTAIGTGQRGGGFGSSSPGLAVSLRTWANSVVDFRGADAGVRLVRTAP